MKILQLVNRIPYPLNDGGNLGVNFYSEGFLDAGVDLSMLAMNTTRHWVAPEKLPGIFKRFTHFDYVKVDNRIRPWAAFCNLFTKDSYHVVRFISDDYKAALIRMLQQETFDIIQLEGLYLMPYVSVIRKYSRAKIILRQHNAEFLIWQRLAEQEQNIIKKKYLALLAERLKTFEQNHLNKADMILAVSKKDAEIFRKMDTTIPIVVQSFGIDTATIPFVPCATPPISLYHIGAMDWPSNEEGVLFLIKRVMPLIVTKMPEAVLHLAGRNMPDYFFKQKWPYVVVHGAVPDAFEFEKDKSILIVPIHSGGGIRIKIFKAMAMGKVVVSTPVGIEGIEVTNGKEAIIANNARDMADKVVDLMNHPEKIAEIGRQARDFILKHNDRGTMISKLLEEYHKLS